MKKIMREFAALIEDYANRYPSHYGYTLFMRRMRATVDDYPFFVDHYEKNNSH
jgi:hypothetical protein